METQRYKQHYPELVFNMAILGLTEKEMATILGVCIETFNYWKKAKRGFGSKLEKGKRPANAKVARHFYLNCIDRYVEEEQVVVVDHEIHKVKVKKFQKGNWQAQAKFLALRERALYAEVKQLEITNNVNVKIATIDLTDFKPEEIAVMNKMRLKQLAESANQS
jgi:hypothetical protein